MDAETAPLAIAFVAGIASFLSPCHLALVPIYLVVLGGGPTTTGLPFNRGRAIRRAALFGVGFSLAMIALGMSVGLVGYLLWDQIPWLRKVGGALLALFGLHVAGLVTLPALRREWRWLPRAEAAQSSGGALLLGAAVGLGWTPCIGPVLSAILLLAASNATVWEGGALLAVYAAGLNVPFLGLALLFGRGANVLTALRRFARPIEFATGGALVLIGVALYTNQFQRLASLLSAWAPL